MSRPPKTPLCEWLDCSADAVAEVHAQWTIVDFVEYLTCAKHAWDMVDVLRERTVDGERPLDVWTKWWDF